MLGMAGPASVSAEAERARMEVVFAAMMVIALQSRS